MRHKIIAFLLLGSVWYMASAKAHRPPQNGQSARYVCADGRRIEILYGGGDTVLTLGNAVAQLERSTDSDQELYVGSGWTWSVTGRRSGLLGAAGAPHTVACQVG